MGIDERVFGFVLFFVERAQGFGEVEAFVALGVPHFVVVGHVVLAHLALEAPGIVRLQVYVCGVGVLLGCALLLELVLEIAVAGLIDRLRVEHALQLLLGLQRLE